jgi:hypothetical protein
MLCDFNDISSRSDLSPLARHRGGASGVESVSVNSVVDVLALC